MEIESLQRYEMSADIIDSKMLMGKTRDKVFVLLGKKTGQNVDKTLYYETGYMPGLNNDCAQLIIRFENGIVVSVNQSPAN